MWLHVVRVLELLLMQSRSFRTSQTPCLFSTFKSLFLCFKEADHVYLLTDAGGVRGAGFRGVSSVQRSCLLRTNQSAAFGTADQSFYFLFEPAEVTFPPEETVLEISPVSLAR